MPTPIYLDVDTGVDDALALLLAARHPGLEIRGVTTVVGNVDLPQVTRNTLQVLELAGAGDVPVVAGAARPLVAPARSAARVHGDDGLGGADLPPPRAPDGDDAVEFLRSALLAEPEPVTLVALAPLTNIAMLLRAAPEVVPKIREIALMGGAVYVGNATPVAEFNIFHDPEAADVVFRSGLPILMYGLEVFRKVRFDGEEVAHGFAPPDAAPNGSVAALAAHLLRFMMRNFKRPDASIGDAGCVACVIDRSGLECRRLPVYVETGGRHCRGQTVVDLRPSGIQEVNHELETPSLVDVALEIDVPHYKRLFREAVGA